MPLITVFRLLLVSFVVLYLSAMTMSGLAPDSPAEVLAYEGWVQAQPSTQPLIWALLVVVGHILDVVGLVLLFLRRKAGVYFLIAGFIVCLGMGTDVPYLQTSLVATLMAFTNMVWGAIVALAFAVPQALFRARTAA